MSAVDWVCKKFSLESASGQLSAITICSQRASLTHAQTLPLAVTLHLHYTFNSTIKNFSACCNTSRGIKLAVSEADRLRSACSLAIKSFRKKLRKLKQERRV